MIPKVGDVIYIESDRYKGDATITYIDYKLLNQHHMYPIQCEIEEGDLDKFDDFNDGQTMFRTNLKEVAGVQTPDNIIVGEEQGSLFDDF